MTNEIPIGHASSAGRGLRIPDRVLLGALGLSAVGHTIGTFALLEMGTPLFVWSLAGALAVWLLVAFHALRAARPSDRAVAWIAVVGSVGWALVALLFGASIGDVADPRALMHAVSALGLAGLGGLQLARRDPA